MAKKVIWTSSARISRRLILDFRFFRTGNKRYSRKLSKEFNNRIDHLKKFPEMGKKSDHPPVITTACGHFSIFYLNTPEAIVIVGIYDTRRNPEDIGDQISTFNP